MFEHELVISGTKILFITLVVPSCVWLLPHVTLVMKWASSRESLSSGFTTKRVSNHSPQLHRLAKKIKFHL